MSKLQQYYQEWKKRGAKFHNCTDLKLLDLVFDQVLMLPLDKMAVFADPVTRMAVKDPQCFQELRENVSQYDVSQLNATAAGNFALLAIACPDPQVRRNAVFGIFWMLKKQGVIRKTPLQ